MPLKELQAGPEESRERARKSKGWGLCNLAMENRQRSGREADPGQEKPELEQNARMADTECVWAGPGLGFCAVHCAHAGGCHTLAEGMSLGTLCL